MSRSRSRSRLPTRPRGASPALTPGAPARANTARSPVGADSAPNAGPANDVLLPDQCRARPGTESDMVVNLLSGPLTPSEVEAIAQRLAALLLRDP